MIIYIVLIILVFLILVTWFTISKILKLDRYIKDLSHDIILLEEKIIDAAEETKKHLPTVTTAPQKKDTRLYDITKLVLDLTFTLIYKQKYEKLKDIYDFLKKTLD